MSRALKIFDAIVGDLNTRMNGWLPSMLYCYVVVDPLKFTMLDQYGFLLISLRLSRSENILTFSASVYSSLK